MTTVRQRFNGLEEYSGIKLGITKTVKTFQTVLIVQNNTENSQTTSKEQSVKINERPQTLQ